jgi:hypothetical protein
MWRDHFGKCLEPVVRLLDDDLKQTMFFIVYMLQLFYELYCTIKGKAIPVEAYYSCRGVPGRKIPMI